MASDIKTEIVLIGAGIMSATLAAFLKELMPAAEISIFERLDEVAAESSEAWNNAGTGHAGFCELNYTPEKEDGTIDITKALKVSSSYEVSRQFWSYLVTKGYIKNPDTFINYAPHISFVWGEENVRYLKRRYDALIPYALFKGMEYSEDRSILNKWMPLVMDGREVNEKVAATRMEIGTDVDFGSLTREMIQHLQTLGVKVYMQHEVRAIEKKKKGNWRLKIKDLKEDKKIKVDASFVFIGAGGGSLPLLEKSDIEEAEGYGGFPVSGQWLRCTNEEIIQKHAAKVYGKASVGAPPMSVPHLDTRVINGKKELLFGPYAGFSTKFLKNGSYFDLPFSIEFDNILPMISAGWHNMALTKYLIEQATQSDEDRLKSLKDYFPEARMEDWKLEIAGQRVQVIKKDEEEGGVLEFGTEIVSAGDGSLAALLGASPGASTSVSIMIDVLKKCFREKFETNEWQQKLREMIPSYGKSLSDDQVLCEEIRKYTAEKLKL